MCPNLAEFEKFESLVQCKLRYYEAGKGDTLLLLHGMGVYTSADSFQFVFEQLAEKFHVIAPDLPGFGKSDRVLAHGPTFDVIVDALREFIDIRGIAPVHVLAHSAGSWFATILAYESPERVASMTLLGPAGLNVQPIAAVKSYSSPTVESLAKMNMASVYEGSSFSAEMANELAQQMLGYAEMPGAFDGLKPLIAQMSNPDVRKSYLLQRRLPYTRQPILVVWGEKEGMDPFPTWTAEWESSQHNPVHGSKPWVSPEMRFELIPGATHNLHWEHPQRVCELVMAHSGR